MTDSLCWSLEAELAPKAEFGSQSELCGQDCWLHSEFLLNEWGVFEKREKRAGGTGGLFGAMLSARGGDGAELTIQLYSRAAIKWSKATDVKLFPEYGVVEIYGNRDDMIALELTKEMYDEAVDFVWRRRGQNPANAAPDADAAKWMLWSKASDWLEEPPQSLMEMIEKEAAMERRITNEALEQTILDGYGDYEV